MVPDATRLGKELCEAKTKLSRASDETAAAYWRGVAEKRVQQYVQLIHAETPSELEASLKDSSIFATKADMTGFIGLLFDAKLDGEANTNPQVWT